MKTPKHKPYWRLKKALRDRDISYRDLSRLLSISVAAVSDKINGKSDFLLSEISRIEEAYSIPHSVFLPDGFR